MAVILAECPTHGLVETEAIFVGDGVVKVTNSKVSCPVAGCGQMANMMDGEYIARDSAHLSTLYTPTELARRRLETVLGWALAELQKPEPDEERVSKAIQAQLEKASPLLFERLRLWWGSQANANAAAWVGILVAILIAITSNSGISADQLEQILENHDHVDRGESERSTPEDPMPRVVPHQSGQSDQTQES